MKENHLKNKPERRAWNEAAPFFKWTCGDYPEVHAARGKPSFDDQLKAAEKFRQEGNELYSKADWDSALMKCACLVPDYLELLSLCCLATNARILHDPTSRALKFLYLLSVQSIESSSFPDTF
jgi:hypothetical protein